MPRQIQFEGRIIEVPDDASDAEVAQILGGQPSAAPAPTAAAQPAQGFKETTIGEDIMGALDTTAHYAGFGSQELLRGLSGLAGVPVDLTNSALSGLNEIPGIDGAIPVHRKPVGGSEWLYDLTKGFGVIPEVKPESRIERVFGRVMNELGAMAVPVGAVVGKGAQVGPQGARAMVDGAKNVWQRMFGQALEAGAVDPKGLIAREAAGALAAGTGAGVANEMVGNPQRGDNFWSDLLGSLAGVGIYGTGKAVGGGIKNIAGTISGNPDVASEIVREEVANRLMDNSTRLAEQKAATGRVDTSRLVGSLRTPSAAEEVIPGFQAGIGDRTRDPGLTAFEYNQNTANGGAQSARRANNEFAINDKMQAIAPTGNAGEFRAALESSRNNQLADAATNFETARQNFGVAVDAVQPGMRDATARGSSLRSALQDASDRVKAQVDELWAPINQAQTKVDIGPLNEQFGKVTGDLSLNEKRRFMPSEAGLPGEMVQPGTPATPSPILDPSGAPIMKPGQPGNSMQDVKEITGIRNGLTDSIREAEAAGRLNEARVMKQYRDALDGYVEQSVPEALRGPYATARQATFDFKDRFARPGDAISESLRTKEGGGYRLDDSAVTGQFAQPDSGRVNDFRALMKEAGQDPRARNALADEIMAQVGDRVKRPEALRKFIDERSILLGEFPELRSKLQSAGASKQALDAAEMAQAETTKKLTQPGSGRPLANYLQYGDERTVDAVRSVIKAGKPAEAAAELVAAAGGDARSLNNARSAFWEAIKDTGQNSASSATGNRTWSGRKLRDFMDDPSVAAVAKELYKDQPEELENIKKVFSALADADGSVRAKPPGSSGTAGALNNRYDAALTSSAIASRARSVNRGQLSPAIAGIDLIGTYLRRRSAQVQSRTIENLTSAVVNNPGLAADLLEEFNPADYAAKRRMILQKYGTRATQVINALDEAQDPDADTKEAIGR